MRIRCLGGLLKHIIDVLFHFTSPRNDIADTSLGLTKRCYKISTTISFPLMVLGTCVILNESGRSALKPESITISGQQHGFIVNFTVKQVFRRSSSVAEDIRYIVPNNSKICMYGTTFRIGGEEIRVSLE
jgi:hypothetical protein